jgi:uncharacterized membrane protein YkoI
MKMTSWALAAFATVATSTLAVADRAPTVAERAHVEAILHAQGFRQWEELELDDDVWLVDGALGFDGRRYHVEIDARTFAIVERDPD